MKIFGIVGSSLEQLGGTKKDGLVEMKERRPSAEHVANKNGEWVLPMTLVEKFEAKEITEIEYAELIRQERDNLITQIENSKEYKRALRLYRNGDSMVLSVFDEKIETLLNIPQSKGFPKTFTGFEEFNL